MKLIFSFILLKNTILVILFLGDCMFWMCLKIFFARILDVSLGTIRTILTIKGKRIPSSLMGFIEVFVWFVIVKEALNTTSNSLFVAISYAAGFASGTYIGGILSDTFIQENVGVQVITSKKDKTLIDYIRKQGYGVSVIDVNTHDKETSKYLLFIEINQKQLPKLKNLIKTLDEKAFIVVNETKFVENGYFK